MIISILLPKSQNNPKIIKIWGVCITFREIKNYTKMNTPGTPPPPLDEFFHMLGTRSSLH
jgi:hypothetical protein